MKPGWVLWVSAFMFQCSLNKVLVAHFDTQVAIVGHNHFLDLDKRTLSIQWEIIGCGAHKLSTYQPSPHIGGSETCGPFDRKIDVYLNE